MKTNTLMSISESSVLSNPCHYRGSGSRCIGGFLYYPEIDSILMSNGMAEPKPVLLEDLPVPCPACEGKGRILTSQGRELSMFMQTFMRPMIAEMIEEILETKL